MHERYAVEHDFLSAEVGWEVVTISRLVNAFFRWEFNSCENLIRGAEVHPIDYANASPDVKAQLERKDRIDAVRWVLSRDASGQQQDRSKGRPGGGRGR